MSEIYLTYINGKDIAKLAMTDAEILDAVERALIAQGNGVGNIFGGKLIVATGEQALHGRQDVTDNGPSGDGMQHFRQVRLHPGALARGKDDAGELAMGHGAFSRDVLGWAGLRDDRRCRPLAPSFCHSRG